MNAPRYFHISDILSVALGNTVTFKDEMTLPDGTQRPAYNTNMDGVIDLIAHITGNELRNPRNPAQYDLDLMMHLLPHVRRQRPNIGPARAGGLQLHARIVEFCQA